MNPQQHGHSFVLVTSAPMGEGVDMRLRRASTPHTHPSPVTWAGYTDARNETVVIHAARAGELAEQSKTAEAA